jgi:Ssp1 endopeptidase immunity protein Rap1a
MLGVCAGTIEGLGYMASLLPREKRPCPPPSVTNGQVVRVVVAYIERRPQRMHENFKELTLEALHDAWPCR